MLWCEVWTRPGHANFGRVIDGPPSTMFSLHDTLNEVGDGSLRMPRSFTRFDDILYTNPTNPAASVSSLVRVYHDSDPTNPIFEWLPRDMQPTTSKTDPDVEVFGFGVKDIMSYARVEAYDWDGSDDWVPSVPDWIYGGRNILTNAGFEESTDVSTQMTLQITATGGSFTLTDGVDTTSAINAPFSDRAGEITNALQNDIAAITDVIVVRTSQTNPSAYLIEFQDPPFGVSLSVNTGSLTGGSATITTTREGESEPNPWTIAQVMVAGYQPNPDLYDDFTVSTAQAHSGSRSLYVNPSAPGPIGNRYGGAQQVMRVTPGQVYQASLWIYPTSATNGFSFRIVTDGEENVARSVVSSLTPNTWTQLTLSDVVIPDGVTTAIFRIQSTILYPNDPAGFYIDDAEFNEGQNANTVGAIIGDLYDDATSDHTGRVVWEDEANPGTPYLTLDFTDAVDSNGDAWVDDSISIKLWMRMTYRQVLDQFARGYGYEWRVVPDDPETGSYLLQIYNPGMMGTDYTSQSGPAIQGGSSDVRRSIRRTLPSATNHLVEGLNRVTSRANTPGLADGLGRIEGQRIDRQAPDMSGAVDAALEDAADATVNANGWVYDLVNPSNVPGVAYGVGDTLTIHDPPDVDEPGRLVDLDVVSNPQETTFEVQFMPAETSPSSPGSP